MSTKTTASLTTDLQAKRDWLKTATYGALHTAAKREIRAIERELAARGAFA